MALTKERNSDKIVKNILEVKLMSDDDKNALSRAASKLKNAKKHKANDSSEATKTSQKSVKNDDDRNDGLIGNIINAVKHFKGDD